MEPPSTRPAKQGTAPDQAAGPGGSLRLRVMNGAIQEMPWLGRDHPLNKRGQP